MAEKKIGRDITLREYLDNSYALHNGHGYHDWLQQRQQPGMTKTRLAEYMNIKRLETIDKWIAAEEKVQGYLCQQRKQAVRN